MSACNRLDLQTLRSQPMIMPNNLPDHWSREMRFLGKIRSKSSYTSPSPTGRSLVVIFRLLLRVVGMYSPEIHSSKISIIMFLKFWTSTAYFSNSTGSSVTSGWFSPFIDSNLRELGLPIHQATCRLAVALYKISTNLEFPHQSWGGCFQHSPMVGIRKA
jgi:hypothetical protein